MADKVLTEDSVAINGDLPVLREFLDELAPLEILEDKRTGRVRVRGEFGRYDEATENKRLYPLPLWEREIKRLESSFGQRKVFGELDHPSDGKTALSRVSHIITNLTVGQDGKIYGEAEILPTSRGKDLAALLRSGCRVGVSSRGYGTTKPNQRGQDVVQEDYRLVAFDFVADPADQDAYPELVSEDVDTGSGRFLFEGVELKVTPLTEEVPDVHVEGVDDDTLEIAKVQVRDEMEAKLSEMLLSRMGEIRAQVEEQVREEFSADPAETQKALALEQISQILSPFMLSEESVDVLAAKDAELADLRAQLEERDARIEELQEEVEEMMEAAQVAGYLCYLERAVSGHPQANRVRRLVGDVTEYASVEEFQERVDAALAELGDLASLQEARHEKAQEERAELIERSGKLELALEKALEALKVTGLRLYAEQRLHTNPHAHKIRSILESVQSIDSKEEVDALIEESRPKKRGRESVRQLAARLSEEFGGGLRGTPRDEEEPWPKPRGGRQLVSEDSGGYNGLSCSLEDLRPLLPPGA